MSGNVASASDEFPSINPKSAGLGLLAGGGEMGERTRSFDWAGSAIGPVEGWPHSLKTAVSICLGSRHPMVVWWDCHTNIQFYNDAYISFLGHAKHPMYLGRSARECWSEIWPIIEPMLAGVYETGEATWSEDLQLVLNRHLPREEGYFTFSYSAIRADDGSVGGIFCACNETTTRVIGERRLRTLRDLNRVEAEAKTVKAACEVASQILAENPGDIPFALVYLLNEEGTIAELMAATALEFDSTFAPSSIRLGSTQSGTTWPLERVLESGTPELISDLPARFGYLPGGLWPEPSEAALLVPIAAPGQTRPAGFLVAGISPRRIVDADYRSFLELVAAHIGTSIVNARAYDQERKRAEALAEIDRAKTAFFSNVSHEFRTPLTLMLGPVEEAAANPEVPRPVRAQLELAHRNSLRLLKLVNSLLDFSRIEAGRVQASFEPTDLGALTSDLASAFRSAMEHAGLSLTVECDELGEPVYIDREMWEKIALNLLSNAFKFTLHGAVTVRLHRVGSDAVLEVQDTGVGVPEHELPRLFERFHRVEGTVGRTQEGSGIGLALVQELVRLHGGRIDAQSEFGHGSTFRVQIPLGKAHLPAARIQAARSLSTTSIGPQAFVEEALRWIPEKADESSSQLPDIIERPSSRIDRRFARSAGARIILADDNADMRAYVRDLLCPAYSVEAVADGEEALIAARRERPNLILCDIMMPRIDGLTLLKNLRADEALRDVPVILLSARAGEEARLEGLDTGADDFLVKPFSARELVARVGALLELTRMRFENEQRYRAFVSATSDVIYRMSPDWREMHELQGRSFIADTQDPTCTWLDKYIHQDDQPHVMSVIQEAIRTQSVFQLEHRVRRVDGSFGWTCSRAIPLKDANGNVIEWFGAASDVTDRKQTEQVLREREQQLRLATEAAEVGLWDVDIITDTLFWPPRVKAMFGISPDVAVSMADFYSGLHPADRERTNEAFDAALDPVRRALYDVEYRTVGKEDGLIRWVAAKGRGIFDTSGRCVRVIGTAIDITSRKLVEERLRRREADLEAADRQKDEFLAMLAHELRNPLASISNASELLSRLVRSGPRTELPLTLLKRQTKQLTRLVDDLLDISRIARGRITLEEKPIEMGTIIAQAVETVQPLIREKNHRFVLAAARSPMYVCGDSARLVQALVNVLHNAAKYTEMHGEIHLQVLDSESAIAIEIRDNGAGISPELLPHVFDLFVQSERTLDRSQGGLGIGLSVVKRLIEMHQGVVSAESEGIGHGSTFKILLPRIPPPLQNTTGTIASVRATARRILLVDDNPDAADSLAMLLRLDGHEVHTAYGAIEALKAADRLKPEMIFLDIGLPEMDGYEVARRLRTNNGHDPLRLVALTGYGQQEDRARSHAAGFDDHLVKPVNPQALEQIFALPSQRGN
jgi:PAS domain S-box-containing protein